MFTNSSNYNNVHGHTCSVNSHSVPPEIRQKATVCTNPFGLCDKLQHLEKEKLLNTHNSSGNLIHITIHIISRVLGQEVDK